MGSSASDVFSESFRQVIKFAKLWGLPSDGLKSLAILANWCDGEIRDSKSDESSGWSVAKWSIRQAWSSKF